MRRLPGRKLITRHGADGESFMSYEVQLLVDVNDNDDGIGDFCNRCNNRISKNFELCNRPSDLF